MRVDCSTTTGAAATRQKGGIRKACFEGVLREVNRCDAEEIARTRRSNDDGRDSVVLLYASEGFP